MIDCSLHGAMMSKHQVTTSFCPPSLRPQVPDCRFTLPSPEHPKPPINQLVFFFLVSSGNGGPSTDASMQLSNVVAFASCFVRTESVCQFMGRNCGENKCRTVANHYHYHIACCSAEVINIHVVTSQTKRSSK